MLYEDKSANIARARENYRRNHDVNGAWGRQRSQERAERSPGQQISVLDARLGAGIGAKRERARLHAQLGV